MERCKMRMLYNVIYVQYRNEDLELYLVAFATQTRRLLPFLLRPHAGSR